MLQNHQKRIASQKIVLHFLGDHLEMMVDLNLKDTFFKNAPKETTIGAMSTQFLSLKLYILYLN